MDLGIKELGSTFIIGAFTILGLELILYYFFGRELTGFFQGRLGLGKREHGGAAKDGAAGGSGDSGGEESKHQSMRIAVFVGLAFAVGVLAEDLSDKYRDTVEIPFKFVTVSISSLVPPEYKKTLGLPLKEDAKVTTLIFDLSGNPEPQPLALELAENRAFSVVHIEKADRVEAWLRDKNRCVPWKEGGKQCPAYSDITVEDVTRCIFRLYYYAKNRSYAVPEYYDEMKKIQTRGDFSRSISLIAFIYLVPAFLITVGRALTDVGKKMPGRGKKVVRSRVLGASLYTLTFIITFVRFVLTQLATFWREILHFIKGPDVAKGGGGEKKFVKMLAVLTILFLIHLLSMWAYEREADAFYKRAFGYYSSMLITSKYVPGLKADDPDKATPNSEGGQPAASPQQPPQPQP